VRAQLPLCSSSDSNATNAIRAVRVRRAVVALLFATALRLATAHVLMVLVSALAARSTLAKHDLLSLLSHSFIHSFARSVLLIKISNNPAIFAT